MTNHFIFDFETFGQDTRSCAVINCAYAIFDWDRVSGDNPYSFDELVDEVIQLRKLDVEYQVKKLGYKIEKGTLEFWSSLPPDVRKQTKPDPSDIQTDEFCDDILRYLRGKQIYAWWTRGNTFDPRIMERLFDDCGKLKELENILKFWLVRDTRTYIDAVTGFSLKKNAFNPLNEKDSERFKVHDAVHDVAMDIMRLQYIEQAAEE